MLNNKGDTMNKEQIVYLPVGKLRHYGNNPRVNDKAVEPVAKSISSFGFKVPIVVDKDYVIINGHTRHKAALKLGLTEVPCIIADSLTPEEIRAFRIVDNRTHEFADWDWDKLLVEVNDLVELDFDLDSFGLNLNSAADDLVDSLLEDEGKPQKSTKEDGKGNSMVSIPIPTERIPEWNSYRRVHDDTEVTRFILSLLDKEKRRK
jgi:ParB-like chromosome segregation protein Spo0J